MNGYNYLVIANSAVFIIIVDVIKFCELQINFYYVICLQVELCTCTSCMPVNSLTEIQYE